jgi:hypothetical protein
MLGHQPHERVVCAILHRGAVSRTFNAPWCSPSIALRLDRGATGTANIVAPPRSCMFIRELPPDSKHIIGGRFTGLNCPRKRL